MSQNTDLTGPATGQDSMFSRRGLGIFAVTIGAAAIGGAAVMPAAQAADTYNMGSATLYRGYKWQGKGNGYVKNLQKAMNDLTGAGLKVDGSFGVATQKAVKSYQKSKGLTVDGRVGPATKKSINGSKAATPAPSKPKPDPKPSGNYNMGSATLYRSYKWQGKGNGYVKNLQRAMNDLTGAGLKVDGSFGVSTQKAVKSYQRSNGLTVDGRVGPGTKASINSGGGGGSKPEPEDNSNYYKPDNSHSTSAAGAGAILKYTGSGSALVNGTRLRLTAEAMVKAGVIGAVPRTSSLTLGKMTSSVKSFQRKRGLKADGVIGTGTWAQVNKVLGTSYPFTMDKYIANTSSAAKGGDSNARIKAMYSYFNVFVNKSPYTWGGAGYGSDTRVGFDCSGLVYQMVAAGGVVIKSTNPIDHARQSFRSTQAIYKDPKLATYSLSEMRDGDIVSFASSSSRSVSKISHDGIYYKGYLLEAYSKGVRKTKWNGGDIHRDGYSRYVMPKVKRPFV